MIDELIELDKKILIFLNSYHSDWLDPIMLVATNTLAWIPLYLVLLYFIIKDHRQETWLILIGITITIILADQITSSFMKPYFARLRPSQDPALEGLVHIVQGYKGGKFGFASSHAANTFGLATFLWLLFAKKRKWILMMFVWAAVMTYSRIYLGVHYPGDILIGGLIGVLAGIAGFRLFTWLHNIANKRRAGLSRGT